MLNYNRIKERRYIMSTKKTTPKATKKPIVEEKPKLSKAGEWLRKHPNGIGKIIDYKAVMK